MKKLSIIIVNWNTKDLVLECINSIYEFTKNVDFEVIVVDNGSTDGSVEKLRKLNKQIKLIENTQNLGYAKANNQGIKVSKGEYILLMNSDVKAKKGSIQKLLDYANSKKVLGAVIPRLLNRDGSVQASCYNFPTVISAFKEYWLGKKGTFEKYSPKGSLPTAVDVGVMATFLITPRALKEVGDLDERYFMYFEDFDYCRKLKRSGMEVIYLPNAEFIHEHGASGNSVATYDNQWRRLIPSSKNYHGLIKHYLINFVIWSSQKWNSFKNIAK